MHDLKKLPKWAQDRINEAESNRSITGASICDVHVENVGVKHSEHTATAVSAIAEALSQNAKALGELAKSINASGADISFGNGISLSDVRAK